jgi:hypothetical protein
LFWGAGKSAISRAGNQKPKDQKDRGEAEKRDKFLAFSPCAHRQSNINFSSETGCFWAP